MALSAYEINRKLLHILSGTAIPFGILYIPRIPDVPSATVVVILGALFVGSCIFEYIRFNNGTVQRLVAKSFGSMMRPEESAKITGATYIFASSFVCSMLFYTKPYISFMVLCAFILGDAVAAIVGQSIGRIKIGKKSLEGSASCLLVCLILFFLVFPLVPLLLDAWQGRMPVLVGIAASLSITLLELFPLKLSEKIVINDNLSVPVITGILMLLLY
ncbi:MAG: hypothetical protein JW795_13790 [Chitinivibrionales bacterium]|nr:hypothetical protein [Chitinivibrionales bacterium]